jgi:hypothetical protein
MKKKAVFFTILLFLPVLAEAQGYRVELEGRYWMPNLTAEAKFSRYGLGTDVNLKEELDLENKNFPYGRLTLATGPNSRLTLGYMKIDYSADTRVERTFDFGGETFTFGTRVVGDLKANYLRFGWVYQFINLEGGKFKLGTLLEAKGFWGDVSVAAPELNPQIKASYSYTTWLPTLGVALDINPVPWLNFYGEISGQPAWQYGYFFDAEAGIKVIPYKYFSITGGYRIFTVEAQDDPDYAKVSLGGPFLGLSLRF